MADEDDDLEEESLLETPLDKVEPYGYFKDTLLSKSLLAPISALPVVKSLVTNRYLPVTGLQTRQPQLYESLTKILSPQDQQVIQSVIAQADANALATQALAAAQAAQAANGQPQQVNGTTAQ